MPMIYYVTNNFVITIQLQFPEIFNTKLKP